MIGIPITSPAYWVDESCTDDQLRHVFRSTSLEPMPLLEERISCIREAGRILNEVGCVRCLDQELLTLGSNSMAALLPALTRQIAQPLR